METHLYNVFDSAKDIFMFSIRCAESSDAVKSAEANFTGDFYAVRVPDTCSDMKLD